MPLLPGANTLYTDGLSWNSLVRESYQATLLGGDIIATPISEKNFETSSNIFLVGVGCLGARPTWWLGCYCSVAMRARPDSQSQFSEWVQIHTQLCQLGRLTLVEVQDRNVEEYRISIRFPRWFPDAYLEVWYYDPTSPRTTAVEAQLDAILEHFNIEMP